MSQQVTLEEARRGFHEYRFVSREWKGDDLQPHHVWAIFDKVVSRGDEPDVWKHKLANAPRGGYYVTVTNGQRRVEYPVSFHPIDRPVLVVVGGWQ
jgi:hypothetical protein